MMLCAGGQDTGADTCQVSNSWGGKVANFAVTRALWKPSLVVKFK